MDFTKNDDIMCFALHCKVTMRREIILNTTFMKENMNEITKKLLGLSDDELSTTEPSRDENGIYMIFHHLYIEFEDFNKFISFLKIRYMKESDFEQVMLISNILGGFDAIDTYIENFYKDMKIKPSCPKEDIKNEYNWVDVAVGYLPHSREDIRHYIELGYTSTQHLISEIDDKIPLVFYCKKKALPQKPSDDIDNKFIWKTARITSSNSDQEYLDSCIEDGFTLTDAKVDSADRKMPIMFLRKEK
tara:strand:- start:7696 stop:8433 length:738 start_codon:yes stop_codon:yes gene_type:complete